MWKLEVTSKETITPSSPTPPHLRTHKLCWIDRCVKILHFPFILFYPNPDPDSLSTLKTSLSRTLSIFYPVAGELDSDHTFVDCNDRGAHLVEAVATTDSPLSELVAQGLSGCSLNTLLPCSNNSCRNNSGNPLLSVQITTFSGGGIAVAVCISHKISDARSAGAFVAAWAATATNEAQPPLPAFNAASLYPPILQKTYPTMDGPPPNLSIKRFPFDESTITSLRKSSIITNPTRVQTVIALLWRCCMRARGSDRLSKPSMARIVVDMRGKAEPPLPDNLFGNLVWQVATVMTEAEAKSRSRFEEKVSSTIKNIDGERLREYTETDGWPLREETVREIVDEVGDDWDMYFFTSWTRFGFHEADFGFGRPIWVGIGGPVMKNMITLTARGGGDGGMEAWVTLEEEDMIRLERDEEILAYTSSSV